MHYTTAKELDSNLHFHINGKERKPIDYKTANYDASCFAAMVLILNFLTWKGCRQNR